MSSVGSSGALKLSPLCISTLVWGLPSVVTVWVEYFFSTFFRVSGGWAEGIGWIRRSVLLLPLCSSLFYEVFRFVESEQLRSTNSNLPRRSQIVDRSISERQTAETLYIWWDMNVLPALSIIPLYIIVSLQFSNYSSNSESDSSSSFGTNFLFLAMILRIRIYQSLCSGIFTPLSASNNFHWYRWWSVCKLRGT